jgi:hypothetical protein
METAYSRAAGLAIPVFFILIGIEFLVDLAHGTRCCRLAGAINSLSCGIISTGIRVFFSFLGLYTYDWVLGLTLLRLFLEIRGGRFAWALGRR